MIRWLQQAKERRKRAREIRWHEEAIRNVMSEMHLDSFLGMADRTRDDHWRKIAYHRQRIDELRKEATAR